MTGAAHECLTSALSLSPDERADMASRLLDSLAGECADDDDRAWLAEAERRLEAYRRGEGEAVPAHEALRAIRQELGL